MQGASVSLMTVSIAAVAVMVLVSVSAQDPLPEGKCFCRKKDPEPCVLTRLESSSGGTDFCDLTTSVCEPCECVMDEEDGLFICDVVEHPSYSIINELTSECVLDMVMVAMCPDDTCEEFVDYEAMETETGPSRRIATQSDGEKSPEIASNAVTRPVPQQVIEGTAYLVRCLFCNDGPAAPAGQCQSYDCGGNSNVHFYTCCNNAGDACDGETYDGLSAEPYCGLAGANNGGGCAREKPFNCGGCQLQTACKNWVDANFLAIPFTCFNWQDAFEACCKDGNPADGVDGWSNLNLLLPDLLPNRILAQDKLTSPSNRQEQCVQVAVPDDRCCELEECSL